MSEYEQRLQKIERRLGIIEQRLGLTPGPTATSATAGTPAQEPPVWSEAIAKEDRGHSRAGALLGWGGATALVLAAAYLIRLAIESGWLTPSRQIAMAVLAALILIATGMMLRKHDRSYAGLLPAGGIVILFLATYGAHLFYGLVGVNVAAVSIVTVCLLSLWLCRLFDSDLYALFAVVGSYSAPFLLPAFRHELTDLVVYFACWSVVFSLYAIAVGNRLIYLFALYLALAGFDVLWRWNVTSPWAGAAVFQLVNFIIFVIAAAAFSIVRASPMTRTIAWAHIPALLLFYFLEYSLLKQYMPDTAPWMAAMSLAFVAGCYLIARGVLKRDLPGGQLLTMVYAALVLFHAGYIELLPGEARPWIAALLVAAGFISVTLRPGWAMAGAPLWFGIAIIFATNYLRAIFDFRMGEVAGGSILGLVYAAELYLAYVFTRNIEAITPFRSIILFAAHVSAIVAAVHLLDNRFMVSLAWGLLAVACLMIALQQKDKLLGQSSLLVFAASAAKVLLYDLSSATPLVRIGSLVVLGVTFYLGGWLYNKVSRLENE